MLRLAIITRYDGDCLLAKTNYASMICTVTRSDDGKNLSSTITVISLMT